MLFCHYYCKFLFTLNWPIFHVLLQIGPCFPNVNFWKLSEEDFQARSFSFVQPTASKHSRGCSDITQTVDDLLTQMPKFI